MFSNFRFHLDVDDLDGDDLQILVLVDFQLKSNFRTASTRRILAAKENALEGATKLRIEDGVDDLLEWTKEERKKKRTSRNGDDIRDCLNDKALQLRYF